MIAALFYDGRSFAAEFVEGVADGVDEGGGPEDFGGEGDGGGGVVERVGVEGEGEEGREEAYGAEDGGPYGDAFAEKLEANDGDGEHGQVGENVELVGGIVEDVEGFCGAGTRASEDDDGRDDE